MDADVHSQYIAGRESNAIQRPHETRPMGSLSIPNGVAAAQSRSDIQLIDARGYDSESSSHDAINGLNSAAESFDIPWGNKMDLELASPPSIHLAPK